MTIRPDTDAAFFEDWSEWEVLGGKTANHTWEIEGGDYWCILHHSILDLDKQPGFALRVPENVHIHRLLKSVGAVNPQPTRQPRKHDEDRLRMYVPAARWCELRAALPAIKQLIKDRNP